MNSEIIQMTGSALILLGAFGFLFSNKVLSEACKVLQWAGLSILFFSESEQLGLATLVMGFFLLGIESVFLTDDLVSNHSNSRTRIALGLLATTLLAAPFFLEIPETRQAAAAAADWHAYYAGFESVLIRASFVVLVGIFFIGNLRRDTHE